MTTTQGRVAVVTGASSGIGEATARALAAGSYRVALLARRLDRITALADELGNGSIAIQADVTDRDSLASAAGWVGQELGSASVLVNNAGVMLLGPFGSSQRDDYRQMIEVNLMGAITATEVFLNQLKDSGGDIVNISSVAGRTARAGNGVYAATKPKKKHLHEAISQRRRQVCGRLSATGHPADLTLVEIDHPDDFAPLTDPKFALRLGCADAGRLTQFINTPSGKRKTATRTSIEHRSLQS